MNRRELLYFLALELIAIAVAGGSFALIESRLAAGLVAGAYFVGFSAWVLRRIIRWPDRWRALTLYPLVVHLFVVSIPLVITRLIHADVAFEDVRILGMAGPNFHRLSTRVFSVLMVATLGDLVRAWRAAKGSPREVRSNGWF